MTEPKRPKGPDDLRGPESPTTVEETRPPTESLSAPGAGNAALRVGGDNHQTNTTISITLLGGPEQLDAVRSILVAAGRSAPEATRASLGFGAATGERLPPDLETTHRAQQQTRQVVHRVLRRISEISDEGRCDHEAIKKSLEKCEVVVDDPRSCHEVTRAHFAENITGPEVLHLSGGWDTHTGKLVLKDEQIDLEHVVPFLRRLPRHPVLLVINFFPGGDELTDALKEFFPFIVVWKHEVEPQAAEQFAERLYDYLVPGGYGLKEAIGTAHWVLGPALAGVPEPEVIADEAESQKPFFTLVRRSDGSAEPSGVGPPVGRAPGGGPAGPAAEEQLNPRKGV